MPEVQRTVSAQMSEQDRDRAIAMWARQASGPAVIAALVAEVMRTSDYPPEVWQQAQQQVEDERGEGE